MLNKHFKLFSIIFIILTMVVISTACSNKNKVDTKEVSTEAQSTDAQPASNSTGHLQEEDGLLKYVYKDGSIAKDTFIEKDGKTYYFENDGSAVRGLCFINDEEYYFDEAYTLVKNQKFEFFETDDKGRIKAYQLNVDASDENNINCTLIKGDNSTFDPPQWFKNMVSYIWKNRKEEELKQLTEIRNIVTFTYETEYSLSQSDRYLTIAEIFVVRSIIGEYLYSKAPYCDGMVKNPAGGYKYNYDEVDYWYDMALTSKRLKFIACEQFYNGSGCHIDEDMIYTIIDEEMNVFYDKYEEIDNE